MKTTPGNIVPMLPPPGLERLLAHRIYGTESLLYQRILDCVVGQPGVRYAELKRLLRGRNNNLLTKALHKLQSEGLMFRRGFGDQTAGYELTWLGILVRDVIVEFRAADRMALGAKQGAPRRGRSGA